MQCCVVKCSVYIVGRWARETEELAGSATMLFYMTEEGQEGRNAFLEKRPPDFGRFPRRP